MKPNQPNPFERETLELKVTALLLGELDGADQRELECRLERDDALRAFRDRMANTIGRVRDLHSAAASAASAVVPGEVSESAAEPAPAQLSEERRRALRERFKKPASPETAAPGPASSKAARTMASWWLALTGVMSRVRQPAWTIPLAAACAVVAIAVALAGLLLPPLGKAKEKAMSTAQIRELPEFRFGRDASPRISTGLNPSHSFSENFDVNGRRRELGEVQANEFVMTQPQDPAASHYFDRAGDVREEVKNAQSAPIAGTTAGSGNYLFDSGAEPGSDGNRALGLAVVDNKRAAGLKESEVALDRYAAKAPSGAIFLPVQQEAPPPTPANRPVDFGEVNGRAIRLPAGGVQFFGGVAPQATLESLAEGGRPVLGVEVRTAEKANVPAPAGGPQATELWARVPEPNTLNFSDYSGPATPPVGFVVSEPLAKSDPSDGQLGVEAQRGRIAAGGGFGGGGGAGGVAYGTTWAATPPPSEPAPAAPAAARRFGAPAPTSESHAEPPPVQEGLELSRVDSESRDKARMMRDFDVDFENGTLRDTRDGLQTEARLSRLRGGRLEEKPLAQLTQTIEPMFKRKAESESAAVDALELPALSDELRRMPQRPANPTPAPGQAGASVSADHEPVSRLSSIRLKDVEATGVVRESVVSGTRGLERSVATNRAGGRELLALSKQVESESRAKAVTDLAATSTAAPVDEAKVTAGKEVAQQVMLEEMEVEEAARQMTPTPAVPLPETLTSVNPYSTFSLNVSDVSFKLASSSLASGAMPEPGTIRSEEFVNAMDYHDPAPAPGSDLAMAWEQAVNPFEHNRDLVRISMQTAAVGREPGRPLNLVILLDNSGSMERADRVRIVREALAVLAGQLTEQDKVSVVSFARSPRLWVDGMRGGDAAGLMERVGGLNPEGGTNLELALQEGYRTAEKHFLAGGNNRVIVLTDGAANLGNVDPATLKGMVETHRRKDIALDCFGVGWQGYNDALLEMLSRNGDGRYGFLNDPVEAARDFAGQLAGALRVAASDVKAQVEFNPDRVVSYRQIGYEKHQLTKEQFRDNTVDAAEIGAAESGTALYSIQLKPDGSGPLGVVRVRYKSPSTGRYHEREWLLPHQPAVPALDRAYPSMRLAAVAAAFAEWLAGSPYAGQVNPAALQTYLEGVPETYPLDSRPAQLRAMIGQARAIAGQ